MAINREIPIDVNEPYLMAKVQKECRKHSQTCVGCAFWTVEEHDNGNYEECYFSDRTPCYWVDDEILMLLGDKKYEIQKERQHRQINSFDDVLG